MIRKQIWIAPVLLLCGAVSALAADTVLTWPANGNGAILRFTVGKLRQMNSVSGQSDYLGEALAENLSTKTIPSASFYLYLLDKNGKRVGEGYLEVSNLAAGQRAKIPVSAHVLGSFASMEITAAASALRRTDEGQDAYQQHSIGSQPQTRFSRLRSNSSGAAHRTRQTRTGV